MKITFLVVCCVFTSLFSQCQTSYTFTGSGSWSIASNWSNNLIPPNTLPAGDTINISPAGGAACILDLFQTIAAGAFLNVTPGANFIITGNLNVAADTVLQQLKLGLLAYYPFNGNAADESGNGYDLSVQGSLMTANRFGQSQKAYNFNGSSDMMIVPPILKADSLREFTISAWVNAADVNYNAFLSFLSKEPHNCSNFFGLYYGLQYKFYNKIITKFSPSLCNLVIIEDTIENPLNRWCHFVLVQHYNTQYPSFPYYQYDMYFNGRLLKAANSGIGTIPIAACFNQGGQVGATSNGDTLFSFYYFKGAIDDIRIYNRVLTAEEISKLYHFQE
jgi:hypothetical protein